MGRLCRFREILARAAAGVDQTACPKLAPDAKIAIAALALAVWTVRSANIGTFVPANAQPLQILNHGAGVLGP
jgi:hypothetical protein